MTVTIAGEFELNTFEPIMFKNLFKSTDLLQNAATMLAKKCIVGITANKQHCLDVLENSVETITKLTPIIG